VTSRGGTTAGVTRLLASPDVVVGRVAALTETGAINRLLILNAEPHPGRGTVLLLREAIGF
jgi:hypothetical protein